MFQNVCILANVSSMLNGNFESEISGDDDPEDALQTRTEGNTIKYRLIDNIRFATDKKTYL